MDIFILESVLILQFMYHALRDLVPLYNFKNTHGGVFFTFFKLYKWYQITQRITGQED